MPEFEWDPRKAASDLRKHGVQFADAVTVLEDDRAITIADNSVDEERWVTIGMDAVSRILAVVFAWRGEKIHIILRGGRPLAKAGNIRRTYEERI